MSRQPLRVVSRWNGAFLIVWCITGLAVPQVARTAESAERTPARRWADAPDAKVLNNLVAELLRVDSPAASSPRSFTLVNPRDGWLWIASRTAGPASVSISIDNVAIHTHGKAGMLESMRHLPKGPHTLAVSTTTGLENLVVRSIPELIFARYGSGIVLLETRANKELRPGGVTCYDRKFLSHDILPNVNVLVGGGGEGEQSMLRDWKAQGKRWLVECGAVGISTKDRVTADDVEKHLTHSVGLTNPDIDGVLIDEFFEGEQDAYAAWIETVHRIHTQEKYRGKLVYPYCSNLYEGNQSSRFIRAIMDCGWSFALERYLPESIDEDAARQAIDLRLGKTIAKWNARIPQASGHMIACMGTFSQPPESLDVNPAMNYKVFLDRQFHLLATDPRSFGLYGMMTYLSSYTEPEVVRWTGKLLRHYAIEGSTAPLSRDPLMLPHVANGDFEQGLNGWQVAAAEPGSIAARSRPGFSWLQGRYPEIKPGNTVLWMKRSAERANVVRQTIQKLEAGRLYTLRMCSADYGDLAVPKKLGIALELEGVELVPRQASQEVYPNCYSHHYGPFNDRRRAWMNYHWILFRARGEQATLRISDWTGANQPGGPVGQELMMNFVQVQPYDQ